jgi:hypothetical protein
MFTSAQTNKIYDDLIQYQLQLSSRVKLETDSKKTKQLEKELQTISGACKAFLKLINYYKKQDEAESKGGSVSETTKPVVTKKSKKAVVIPTETVDHKLYE